ncbi:MAG: hypothetical protein IKM84_08510 [Oscillospiraceae bacterium]|nr:hypothetical protein [Oscillospiraceae bacterium]
MVILLLYMAAGYWAVGRTLWADKVVFGSATTIFVQRVIWGTLLGWILIPFALIKLLTNKD